jgi:hypothetical protein
MHLRGAVYPATTSTLATDGVATVRIIIAWIKEMSGNPGIASGSTLPTYEDFFDAPNTATMGVGYIHLPKTWENSKNIKFLVDKSYTFSAANSGALAPKDVQFDLDLRSLGPSKYNTAGATGNATASQGHIFMFCLCDNSTGVGTHPPIFEYAYRMYYIE